MTRLFNLKIPVTTDKKVFSAFKSRLQQFPSQTEIREDKEHAKLTQGLGIGTTISYFLFFFYIYGSALYKDKISILNPTTKKNFTVSETFENTERIGSTIFLLLLGSLYFTLLVEQGFATRNSSNLEISVVFTNFVFIAVMLLLFLVGPTGSMVKMGGHALLTIVIMVFCVYNSYMIPIIYKEIYSSELLDNMEYMSYTMIALMFSIIIIYSILTAIRYYKPNYTKTILTLITTISVIEIIFLSIFGSIFAIFGQLPALVHQDKMCIGLLE